MLSESQMKRFSRNVVLDEIGVSGQEKLLAGRVLIAGAGGLGSSAAFYLAAMGVGHIGIADYDKVDLSNLQRQILHSTSDIGRMKVDSAWDTVKALNPDINIDLYPEKLTEVNIEKIVKQYDFVLVCTDGLDSKFLIADACHFAGKPYSYAGAFRFEGQVMTVMPEKSACYRCVFNSPPHEEREQSSLQAGVIGAMPGIAGSIQALEAVKFLTGIGDLLLNRMLVCDGLGMKIRIIDIKKNPDCPLCGRNPSIMKLRNNY